MRRIASLAPARRGPAAVPPPPARRRSRRRLAAVFPALLALLLPARAAGQGALNQALDLEQQGLLGSAARFYAAALRAEPNNPIALLGLERVGQQVGWRDSAVAYAEHAIALDSADNTARGIEVRGLRALGRDSLASEALARWLAADPRSPMPYREWAQLNLAAGRVSEARDAVTRARERLRSATVLAPEAARVDAADGDWAHAVVEWRAAVGVEPQLARPAAFSLRAAPVAARDGVLAALTADGSGASAARRVAADLLLGWNEPARAWTLFRSELPPQGPLRADALRSFADRARATAGPAAQRAAAEAYELLAQLEPAATAVATRVESARAFADAGDAAAAERLLRPLATDPQADSASRSAAVGAMIELAVRAGDPGAAARQLAADSALLTGTEREALGRRIALGWLRRGAVDSAASAIAGDASLDGLEVRGWVDLYRGDLAGAREALAAVGATGGDTARAAERAATVGLLDAVGRDTLPALGAALLLAARGDTAAAWHALVPLARGAGGAAEPALLGWAARLAAASGDGTGGEALWREVAERFPASAGAPAAELGLARALARRGDLRGAQAQLEAMILAHPESALVPEARRLLDRVRGAVP